MVIKGSWTRSKCIARMLIPYIAASVIPEFKKNRWRIPTAAETEPLPRPGEFVVFVSFLDRGFAIPTSTFFHQLLVFYNIKILDLGPHNIQQIALFVALCENYLCCEPYFPLWLHIFHGRATCVSKSNRSLIAAGGITFQVRPGEDFIYLELPKKAQSEWRKYWFYVLETTVDEVAIAQYTPEPSVPRRLSVWSLPATQSAVVREMCARIMNLKTAGLKAINLYNSTLGRRPAPLQLRGHLMYQYQGLNDPTRLNATEWDEAEYVKALGKITTAAFTSFDEELQPYSPDEPGPTVPEELKEEDDEAVGEDEDNEVTESDSEATAMDPVGHARGQKRSVASSSQQTCEEGEEEEEGEEATLPMKEDPSQTVEGQRAKRTRQTTILESHEQAENVEEIHAHAGAAATKAAEGKKAVEAEATKVADTKKAAEVEAAKAADTKEIPSKEKVVPTEEGAATRARADEEETAKATGPSSAPTGAAQQTASRERWSKRAADPAHTGGPPPSEMDETSVAGKEASTDATAHVSQGAAANPVLVEEEVDQAEAHPLPSYSFVEMHRALGILHKRELDEATAEIQRLNAEVAEAAKKNQLLITAGKEREKVLAQARVGYVLESEVAAKL
ncbi:hypothetical protein ACQ4PT_032721 [Festuca glaucescens]